MRLYIIQALWRAIAMIQQNDYWKGYIFIYDGEQD